VFVFKILFVISLISFQKICNRPSQIHCLNSDGTGDLSLLRYKPDFVTSLFFINELYCTTNHKEYVKEKKLIATHAPWKKNVDIEFECTQHVSGIALIRSAQSRKISKQNNLKVFGSKKTHYLSLIVRC
jgi:hypothetical protein